VSSLQAVAMGLVIVFLDVGPGGWDWIADPIGWVLLLIGLSPLKERVPNQTGLVVAGWVCLVVSVLVFLPDSVATLAPFLGWLFSLPTIGFCFLLCDSLEESTPASLAVRFRWLRWAFVVVAVLPFLVFVVGWEWLTIPTAVVAVLTNIVMVFTVWAAGDDDEQDEPETKPVRKPVREEPPAPEPKAGGRRKKRDQGFDAEAVKRRVRRERGE
jgi:hypothetical protein